MTSFDEESLGLRLDLRPLSTLSSAQSLPSGRAQGETGTQDLEEQRRTAALAIADLILVLWPRHRMADLLTTHSTPSKAIKQRTKLATQLKSAIATLWSSQSLFQERTRLVLDIYQDPIELEREDRVRTLRSRHVNNILSTTLGLAECSQLARKFKDDQEKMTLILDRLQSV